MVSIKPDASCMLSTIEDLKASRREIQSQQSTLGLLISTLDARISTLESQLREYAGREIDVRSGLRSNCAKVGETTPSDGVARIIVKVFYQVGQVISIRMTRDTQMEKLMIAWCDHRSVVYEDVGFVFKGRRIRDDQTPEQLKMKDGDEIDAVLRLVGGGWGALCSGVCIE